MGKTIVVERTPLSVAEKTYLPQIVQGLKVTFSQMIKPSVTLQYPDERPVIPEGYRGAPTLVKDPNGREKCVSCQLCEFVCPPKAIRIVPGSIEETSEYAHIEKAPEGFEIDMLRCIYCGLCQEVCPEEAIWLQNDFSINGLNRQEMVHDKERLYQRGGTLPDAHYKWEKKKQVALSSERSH